MASSPVEDDMLNLSNNADCRKMLSKMGVNSPEAERVVMSVELVKINKRLVMSNEQIRVLLLTDKALYNLKPDNMRKCRRRIGFEKIGSVTLSADSMEFAIHIPEEHDYRYKSEHKDRIASVLAEVYKQNIGRDLVIREKSKDEMMESIMTKESARSLSVEDRANRFQELLHDEKEKEHKDDGVDLVQKEEEQKDLFLIRNRVADLCFNKIIPEIPRSRFRDVLIENESLIHSVFVDHDIHILNAHRMDEDDFVDYMKTPLLYIAALDLYSKMVERMESMGCVLKWKHIVNAIGHEMTRAIARNVLSVTSYINGFDGDGLISAIKFNTNRVLTVSEENYLRSVVRRATDKVSLIPKDDASYVGGVLHFIPKIKAIPQHLPSEQIPPLIEIGGGSDTEIQSAVH